MSLKLILLLSLLGIIFANNIGIHAVPLHNAPNSSESEEISSINLQPKRVPPSSEELVIKSRTKRGIKISNSFGASKPVAQRPRSNSLPASLPSRTTSGGSGFNFNSGNSFGSGSNGKSFSSPLSSSSILQPTSSFGSKSNLNTGGGTGNLFSNNGISRPRSNSLSSSTGTGLFGSGGTSSALSSSSSLLGKNNGLPKPKFGMDRASSSSSSSGNSPRITGLPSPVTSPLNSGTSSRRSSFGLQDEMERLSIRPKTTAELRQVDTWEKRPINSADLTQNCYFCTAAGLSGRTTNQMVKKTETMQTPTGSLDNTKDLLQQSYHPKTISRQFSDTTSMNRYLDQRLEPGTSDKFGVGYFPNGPGDTGHMVAMKAWKAPDGTLGTRPVDFQLPPQQRFPPAVMNNNFSPPGPVHLIDLNPMPPTWNKRPQFQSPEGEPDSKRSRIFGP